MSAPDEMLGIPADATVSDVRRAYRALARRWHPDRFAPGPEREWANGKMSEINSAYRAAIKKASARDSGDDEKLSRAKRLIDDGRLSLARELLMSMPTRCAEWNYLFGEILVKLAEYKKALIYLSVAVHQKPDSEKYNAAFLNARSYIYIKDKILRLFRR